MEFQRLFWGSILFYLLFSCQSVSTDWADYLGGSDRNHYSTLSQINVNNVADLTQVWQYNSLDTGEMQCNPIIIAGVLYGQTATKQVFALDAATGKELWKFKPPGKSNIQRGRGVTYWTDGEESRIFTSNQEYLYALDATTGEVVPTFGEAGRISLKGRLGDQQDQYYVVSRTPGAIYKNMIIMPLTMQEGEGGTPGYIQAIDVRDGSVQWTFQTIPEPGEYGSETWPAEAYEQDIVGGANSWAGMAIDAERGIVFVPTGSASPDFFGGDRKGENLFANCLLALDAETGERLWHYQMVRHDIWDRDLPAPPSLTTIRKEGQLIDVVTQTTKTGHVFVFNRETGESIFPIDSISVPESPISEEAAWPVQRLPRLPKAYSRQTLTVDDINPYSPHRDSLKEVFENANKGYYMPLSEKPTILFPGCDGGAEWGGTAIDPNGIMYVNSNEMAWNFTLSRKTLKSVRTTLGKLTYQKNCASCHQDNFSGSPESGYPALTQLQERFEKSDVLAVIEQGRGRMPGFPKLKTAEKSALIAFLYGEVEMEYDQEITTDPRITYQFNGYKKFLDREGNPGISPPWGQLTAIDLNSGLHLWQIPLGQDSTLAKKGILGTGTENYGGPIVTEGGLLFIAATKDGKFRAFESRTGTLLWEVDLPAAGFATPSTYSVNGKQYIVVACGGGKLGTKAGDSYVSFALP